MPINVSHGSYAIGPDVRPSRTERPVAIAVRVCADLKIGDREFSAEINMHEVVALRRFYDALGGGTVRLTAYWPPGMPREIPLTNEQLQRELERMRNSFVVIQESGMTTMVVEELFGPEPAEQLRRLHQTMKEQYEEWRKLVATAKERVPDATSMDPGLALAAAYERMADTELEAIARLADPASRMPDFIELPTLETSPETTAAQQAEQEVQDEVLERQLAHIEAAGFKREQAMSLLALRSMYTEITDDLISDALNTSSKAKIATARGALQSLPAA